MRVDELERMRSDSEEKVKRTLAEVDEAMGAQETPPSPLE